MSNQNKHVPFVIKQGGDITMYLNGESMTVSAGHPNYSKVKDALKTGQFYLIENLVNVAKAITKFAKGQIKVQDGEVFYGNTPVHNTLTARIISMMNEGFKFDHMLLFLENLMANPSFRAVNETYTFLENHGLPITEDGCFLAYKAIRNDYTDIRTGKFNNRVGQTPSMPRNQVDENYEQDCSSGLHVGALEYVVSFGAFTKGAFVGTNGNRLVIVKVNPRDVVSVPRYAGHTKMRVSTYTVISEVVDVVKELDKIVYKSDGTELAPDAPAPKADDRVDSADYDAGWEAGWSDVDNGENYGHSRNYGLKGAYLQGYNDAYNERPYAGEEQVSSGQPEDFDGDEEYQAGFNQGDDDRRYDLDEGTNLEFDASDDFKRGYADGYNS